MQGRIKPLAVTFFFSVFAAACGQDDNNQPPPAPDPPPPCENESGWWIWDLSQMPPVDTQITGSVRRDGYTVCVVVSDDAWGNTVSPDMINNLVEAWDESTVADDSRGIYELVTGLFGSPPDVFDGDPRIYLFLYEMAGYSGFTFDGYFKVDDQEDRPTSNKREMLHINTAVRAPDSPYMLAVQAHEFQHLIHWRYDQNEVGWLNEAMSEVAMVITGFDDDAAHVASWLQNPSDPIMYNGPDYAYGALLLFGTYLWERFGDSFITSVVADTRQGASSLDALLNGVDPTLYFSEVLADFGLAVAINDTAVAGGIYGYNEIDFGTVQAGTVSTALTTRTAGADGGLVFLQSTESIDGVDLRIESAGHADLGIRVAVQDSNGSHLIDDALTGSLTVIDLGLWPLGDTVLWVVVTNLSASDVSFTAQLL